MRLRASQPPPRARFTAALLYLFGFSFLFSLLFALPALLRTFLALPPEAQSDLALARDVARDALRTRLPLCFAAAVLATGIGIGTRRLPGFRSGRSAGPSVS